MCKSKTSCSCGCTKSVILKEGKIATTSISKGLQYHINTGKPLHETIYRKNTKTYNELFQEARKLYSRNLLEIKNPTDLKLIKDKNYGYLKEGKVGEYTVVWTDRDYKEHKKVFKDDPQGPPENGLKKAKDFKKKLEDKDKKDKYGLYRSISIKENKNYVLDIEGNKVKDISKDGDSCSNRVKRRGDMDDEFGDLPPVPKGVQESRMIKTQVEYRGKKYWVEYTQLDANSKYPYKVFAYLDKDLKHHAKVNGKTLMFTLKDIKDKLIKENMKLKELKKIIREVYLNK